MQDLVSRPHCVTFARPGLYLGPTISYRQDSCRVLTKVAASAVYLCSFRSTRGTHALGISWHFWEISSVTGIIPEEAGNFLEQEDRLLLAPPELTQQHRSTSN